MEIRLKILLHTTVMAIEILLNQVFKWGPLVLKSLCISVQAWLQIWMAVRMNISELRSTHSCCSDAALPLLLLSQAVYFVLPDTRIPAGMQFCRAWIVGNVFTFSGNQNLVFLMPLSHCASKVNMNTGIKGLVLLYWYLVQTTTCPVEANCQLPRSL